MNSSDALRGMAQRLEEEYPRAIERILSQLHAEPLSPPEVHVVGSTAELRAAVSKRFGTPASRLPGSVAGLAYPVYQVMYLNMEVLQRSAGWGSFDARVLATFRHELTHCVLGQYQQRARWPSWFEEGLAQWVERAYQEPSRAILDVRAGVRALPSLGQLATNIRDRRDMALAYAMSEHAVRTLLSRVGGAQLAVFFSHYEQTASFETSFSAAFGSSLAEFEVYWRSQARPADGGERLVTFLGTYWWTLLFGGTALIAFVGAWVRRRRNKAQVAQWEEMDAAGFE